MVGGIGAFLVFRVLDIFPWHFNFGRGSVRDGHIEHTDFSLTGKDDYHFSEKSAKLWGAVIGMRIDTGPEKSPSDQA